MTNKHVALVLKETAELVDLTGGNTFRARAFENAARTIERLEAPVADLAASGELTALKGIGAGLAAQIKEILAYGSFGVRDELLGQVPAGLPGLLRIKGLGAKKAFKLWQELDVTSVDQLEAAAVAGRLASLEGFGAKTQQKLLDEIEAYRKNRERRRYAEALTYARPVLDALRESGAVQRAELAGEMRRTMETVPAVEIIAASADADAVSALLARLGLPASTSIEGEDAVLGGAFPDGFPFFIYVVSQDRFGKALWMRTGSPEHVAAFEAQYGAPGLVEDEAKIYASADLHFIEPELREGTGELEAAASGSLPRLVAVGDLHGTLHNHSNFSDGANTIEEMAAAARALGLSYFGLCDHSRSLVIANGLPVERVLVQQEEIRRLNAAYAASGTRFRIFSGTESDILADGSLDYPDEVLATFDLVVASVHQNFKMTREEATARLVRAIENPYTTILGHATGRLLLSREGYPIDHEAVIAACARSGVAIELNAHPYRLDMDWRWVRRATEQGVLISINPDAHATEELKNTYYGVLIARKGWLTPEQCLNAMPLEQFEAWLEARRARREGIAVA